jgi:hypothetical protein
MNPRADEAIVRSGHVLAAPAVNENPVAIAQRECSLLHDSVDADRERLAGGVRGGRLASFVKRLARGTEEELRR